MGRPRRSAEGGFVYHVLNRANARMTIFERDADYEAFERVLEEAVERTKTRLLAYCLMPNHWHLVVWPREEGELSRFTGWLTLTHTQRWHAHQHTSGTGHLYQGRFKAFPIQEDEHFLTVARYVERNPLRANLVARAEDWRFGGLARRARGGIPRKLLAAWPVPYPRLWKDHVNQAQTDAEESAIRLSIRRGTPFGSAEWRDAKVAELGLESTLRSPGRPRKAMPEP